MRAITLVFILALAASSTLAADNGMGAEPSAPSSTTETTTPSMAETTPTTPSTCPTVSTTGMTMAPDIDKLVMSTVAQFYCISPSMLSQLQTKGYKVNDIAALGNLSSRTGRPFSELVQLHDDGVGWMDMCMRYNVSSSDMMTPVAMVSPEAEKYNRQFAMQYFGLKEPDVSSLRGEGWNWAELYMAANLAARTNKPVTEIAGLFKQGLSWTEIGSRYNIAASDVWAPFSMRGAIAGVTAEGPMPSSVSIVDLYGRTVLTNMDAEMFRRMGHSWRSIAIASNIAVTTGDSVRELLRMTDRGMTWTQIARAKGLDPKAVIDVTSYPFRRDEPLPKTKAEKSRVTPYPSSY